MNDSLTEDEWIFEVRAVRDALIALGESVPPCVSGDGELCGHNTSAQAHYGMYLAMLKARTQLMFDNLPLTDGHFYSTVVYESVIADMAANQEVREDSSDGTEG